MSIIRLKNNTHIKGKVSAKVVLNPILSGLSLLHDSNTLGWWDMHATSAVTSITTTTSGNVSTWTKSAGITVAGGIADPDGGVDGYRVSIAATGSLNIRGANNANFYSGFTRTTCKLRMIDAAIMNYVRLYQHVYGSSFLTALRPSLETINRTESNIYITSTAPNYGAQWLDIGNGWRYVELEELCPHVNTSTVRGQPAILLQAPDGYSHDIFDIYQVSHFQTRISAISDRKGGTALAQSTNDARHTVIPNGWLGRDCAVGVTNGGSSSTASRAVGSGPWLVVGVMQPLRPEFSGTDPVITMTGDTAAISLTITGGTATTRASYSYSFTNDAGAIATGNFGGTLSAVPVAVALIYTGSVLRLYVDGVQVGTDQLVNGTATITGINVLGQSSHTTWTVWAIRSGIHSDSQVQQISLALRNKAGLPALWRMILKTGQSNETDTQQSVDRASVGRRLTIGQALSRRGLNDLYALSYAPWYIASSVYWWIYQDKRQLWGGSGQSAANEASVLGDYGYCICSMGKGGEAISSWQTGGIMRTHTEEQWPLAVADMGTSLVKLEGIIWNQGEADAMYFPTGYKDRLTDVISWLRNLGGNPSAWVVIQRLNSYFTSADPTPIINDQIAFAIADGNAYLAQADFALPYYDGVHYQRWGISVMGKNQYLALRRLAPLSPLTP